MSRGKNLTQSAQVLGDWKALTRGRTDHCTSTKAFDIQQQQQHSVKRIPLPLHTEIGTVPLPPTFSHNAPQLIFGRPFVKQFALCYRSVVCLSVCLSCCPLCDVGVLWPTNGWTDQDETWHAGRLRPWPHCVRWESQLPSPKGEAEPPIFGPYLLWPSGWMDQDATW